jgi:hypothetical protein
MTILGGSTEILRPEVTHDRSDGARPELAGWFEQTVAVRLEI